MSRKLTAVATLSLVVLAGCGDKARDTAEKPAASQSSKEQVRHRQMEVVRADCMKQKGFKYIPYVPPPRKETAEERKRDAGDYPALKEYRRKHGYDVFALYVYPQELGNPMVAPEGPIPPNPNPNTKIMASLSRTQYEAYQAADDACYVRAVKAVIGKDVTSIRDHMEQANARAEQLAKRELNGDPQLVEFAAAMGSCLKGKGYRIDSNQPTALADRGRKAFEGVKKPMGTKIPEDIRKSWGLPEGALYEPDLTVEQARPYLIREIKDALDDLECGKDFYPVFQPRKNETERRTYTEFGIEDWL